MNTPEIPNGPVVADPANTNHRGKALLSLLKNPDPNVTIGDLLELLGGGFRGFGGNITDLPQPRKTTETSTLHTPRELPSPDELTLIADTVGVLRGRQT